MTAKKLAYKMIKCLNCHHIYNKMRQHYCPMCGKKPGQAK